MKIAYRADEVVSVEDALDLYKRATAGTRPKWNTLSSPTIPSKNANLVVTAWDGPRLVGIARTLTDFENIAYVAEVAVDFTFQKMGIGSCLVRETSNRLGRECMMVLCRRVASETLLHEQRV